MILDSDISPAIDEKIPYSTILTNRGNGYNVERREFVCPGDGLYVFYFNSFGRNGAMCRLDIILNGEEVNRSYTDNRYNSSGTSMVVLELENGDTVAVMNVEGGCTLWGTSDKFNSFSGFSID